MSIAIDVAAEDMRMPLPRDRVTAIARSALVAEGVRDALISVTFLTRRRIAALNREHLGHRGATDVISFGFTRASKRDAVIGDVYICPDLARANAASRRIAVREELTRLIVHGVLHVLGHDHPEGDEREESPMWRRQEAIVRRLGRRAS